MKRMRSERFTGRHCEERSDEAIQLAAMPVDCFPRIMSGAAMTGSIRAPLWMFL
jgi:hypothetical protein